MITDLFERSLNPTALLLANTPEVNLGQELLDDPPGNMPGRGVVAGTAGWQCDEVLSNISLCHG